MSRISKYRNNEANRSSKLYERKNSKDKIKKKLLNGSFKLVTPSKQFYKEDPFESQPSQTINQSELGDKIAQGNFTKTPTNFYVKNQQMSRPLTNRMKTRSINKGFP